MDWAEIKARIDHGEDGSTELERTLERQLQEFYNAFGRVQVTSPGALPSHMTVAAMRTGGRIRSRNEQMANYMLDRHYMERRGRGWLVMRRAMLEFNGTEPEIEHDQESRFVTVSFKLTRQLQADA